jgi:hypothetical protein
MARAHMLPEQELPMSNFVVMQVREYRLHKMEVMDHGKAGFTVTIIPPANRGGVPREVTRDSTTVTLADVLNRAKAEIDVVMGPKPAFKPRGFGR